MELEGLEEIRQIERTGCWSKFLRDSFDNFKAREALTQAANLTDQLVPVITSDGAIASAAATAMAVGTSAATTTPTLEWDL